MNSVTDIGLFSFSLTLKSENLDIKLIWEIEDRD